MKGVNEMVGEVLREMKRTDTDDAEYVARTRTLPGFKHLCRAYSVERKGELMIVPIGMMTSSERQARAQLYFKLSIGCAEHARELQRYDRRISGAA
jgi:hypothetical protein